MGCDLILTGLIGTEPLGFLAALGALRALNECCPERFRLAFDPENFVAKLVSNVAISSEEVINLLVDRQKRRVGASEIVFGEEDIKVEPARWAEILRMHRGTPSESFFAAYASDLVLLGNGTGVKPTALHMTAGQQRLIRDLVKLTQGLAADPKKKRGAPSGPSTAESYKEALFGPWRYSDDQHPFGWDPSAERLYAYRAVKPSDDTQGRSSRAAVWLAFEAFPFFPVFARSHGYGAVLATTGFHRDGPETVMLWPLWEPPLSIVTIKWLFSEPAVSKNPHWRTDRTLAARGVLAVCRSVRADLGDKGYAILRPPQVRPIPRS